MAPPYEAILTDSILFIEALKRFREEGGDDFAFEDLSDDMKVLPAGLGEFLRSAAGEALVRYESLDPYLSSLESTGTTPRWLSEAYGDLGKLRTEIRRIRQIATPTKQDRAQLAKVAKEAGSRLSTVSSLVSERQMAYLQNLLRQLESVAQDFDVPTGADSPVSEPESSLVKKAADKMFDISNSVYRELRSFREATAPSHLA